jgi:tetratricopeptide (TPR) repeat protein
MPIKRDWITMKHHLVELDRKALSFREEGKLKEAAELFSAIVREQPDWEHGVGFYDLGICYEDLGQLEKAEEAYRSALRYQPANRDFLGGYASFLYLHGDPEKAFRAHLELLEIERINKDNEEMERTRIALRALGKKMGLSDAEIESRIQKGIFGAPNTP